jgi:hypothetical protein
MRSREHFGVEGADILTRTNDSKNNINTGKSNKNLTRKWSHNTVSLYPHLK